MSPITLAGALTQQNAEALFMISLAQLVRPGTPVVYGGFTSNVDMRTRRARLRHAGICQGGAGDAGSSPGATACPTAPAT